MKLTPKIQKAINFACRLHFGQSRKGSEDLPYVSHPFSVAWILSEYTDDEDVIAAGLLHDVLEDVKNYRFDDLKNDFGERVAIIVKGVSEDKDPNVASNEKATWEHRKKKYLENLQNDSKESLMVCAADKIHNLRSLMSGFHEEGDKFFRNFNSPVGKRLWFFEEVLKILKQKLDSPIVTLLENEIVEAKKFIN